MCLAQPVLYGPQCLTAWNRTDNDDESSMRATTTTTTTTMKIQTLSGKFKPGTGICWWRRLRRSVVRGCWSSHSSASAQPAAAATNCREYLVMLVVQRAVSSACDISNPHCLVSRSVTTNQTFLTGNDYSGVHGKSPGMRPIQHNTTSPYSTTPWGRKKGTNFLLCASYLVLDRNWWIFVTYIRPKESGSISYNSVYLILTIFIRPPHSRQTQTDRQTKYNLQIQLIQS